MKSTVIRHSLLTLLLLAVSSLPVAAAEDEVLEVTSLYRVGKQANIQQVPILLMFAADFCAYCERLEEDFLRPMLRSGDYEDKVLIRKLHIDSEEKIRDFNGDEISPAEIAEQYAVSVTPTVVFIDGDGVELAPKRVGLTTPDFYVGYLDDAISQALDILRRTTPMRVRLSSLN